MRISTLHKLRDIIVRKETYNFRITQRKIAKNGHSLYCPCRLRQASHSQTYLLSYSVAKVVRSLSDPVVTGRTLKEGRTVRWSVAGRSVQRSAQLSAWWARPFSRGREVVPRAAGNRRLSLVADSFRGARTLRRRCTPRCNLRLPDDFQIGSGRPSRIFSHAARSSARDLFSRDTFLTERRRRPLLLLNRRKPGAWSAGNCSAVPSSTLYHGRCRFFRAVTKRSSCFIFRGFLGNRRNVSCGTRDRDSVVFSGLKAERRREAMYRGKNCLMLNRSRPEIR